MCLLRSVCQNIRHACSLVGVRVVQKGFFVNYASIGYGRYLASFYSCAGWFVSNLVGNPKDRFSHDRAQICIMMFVLTDESTSKDVIFVLG